ncbi:hypothetical protein CTEN210_03605 [Chaetoceros tenuissimus]|uniref:Sulfate transporter n=1 Tax=Chaetoceros tenuissimus TaxID=426638 RepID=A0AAD3CM08_9STRA|nr:hypothetical protein CTEN210_03605 [Chaetoceros tenuissimus]
MIAIPYGSSYFSPVIHLPEQSKEILGIRLSLLAVAVGQFVMGGGFGSIGASSMTMIVCIQIGELCPFYHKLAEIVASTTSDENAVLPTTLFLMSLCSVTAGFIFYLIGKCRLGSLIYFFPTHCLFGIIGGIGLWIMILSVSISVSPLVHSLETESLFSLMMHSQFLLCLPLVAVLRILRKIFSSEDFMLLDPCYFMAIPLFSYIFLYANNIHVDEAFDAGYFFAEPGYDSSQTLSMQGALIETKEMWTKFDFHAIDYTTIVPAFTTIFVAGIMCVLVSAPFIPAAAMLQDKSVNVDFDQEFKLNGVCCFLSGIVVPGGLCISTSYSTTVVYKNAGAEGKIASIFLSLLTVVFKILGPIFVPYIPRCLACVMLLDLGFELFTDAVVNHYSKLDRIEYCSVWGIILAINIIDMSAGLVASLVAALLTYMIQSLVDKDPVRISCDTSKIPSSKWRTKNEVEILKSSQGRATIAYFQMHGYIFFGNLCKLSETIHAFLRSKESTCGISSAIFDLSNIIGIDSTSAQFITEMLDKIEEEFDIKALIVSQHFHGLLSSASQKDKANARHPSILIKSIQFTEDLYGSSYRSRFSSQGDLFTSKRGSMIARGNFNVMMEDAEPTIAREFYDSLDEALILCEDMVITQIDRRSLLSLPTFNFKGGDAEKNLLIKYLSEKLDEDSMENVSILATYMTRSEYKKGSTLWTKGEGPSRIFVLTKGLVVVETTGMNSTTQKRTVKAGNILGLEAMTFNQEHASDAICYDHSIAYMLDRKDYLLLCKEQPAASRLLDMYLCKELNRKCMYLSGINQGMGLP